MSMKNIKYVCGDQNIKVPVHLHFGKYLLDHMLRFKDNIALVSGETGEKLTYREFVQYSVNLAMALKEIGIGPGSIVAVSSERRLYYLPTELAILFTGATITPYDPLIGTVTLKHKINTVKPQYLIISKLFWNKYKDILKECDCIKMILTFEDLLESAIPLKRIMAEKNIDIDLFEPEPVKGQTDVAVILYSSGTTGLPKGVLLTHLNCILNSADNCFPEPELQTALVYGQWDHNYCRFMAYKFFAMGRRVVYANDLNTDKLVELIEPYRVNIFFTVPSGVRMLTKKEFQGNVSNSLKVLYSRSSPLHARTMQIIKEKFPSINKIMQGYGMTEAGELSSEIWGTKGPKPGSVGMVTPGCTFKISDIKTEETLGSNVKGEIRIKGPILMKGYIGINSKTYLDEEGFFKTGDMGYYDEDKYFFIIDRIKEIINFNGFKVAPLELETLLLLHPGVKDAGVVGKPDPEIGELPTAFVVKQPNSDVNERDLKDFIKGQVSYYMKLEGGVIFIDEIPRNQRGKILRRKLREML